MTPENYGMMTAKTTKADPALCARSSTGRRAKNALLNASNAAARAGSLTALESVSLYERRSGMIDPDDIERLYCTRCDEEYQVMAGEVECPMCREDTRGKAGHEWDDDACCKHCGFDGAEWHWWRYNTYEGRSMKTPMPPCERRGL